MFLASAFLTNAARLPRGVVLQPLPVQHADVARWSRIQYALIKDLWESRSAAIAEIKNLEEQIEMRKTENLLLSGFVICCLIGVFSFIFLTT